MANCSDVLIVEDDMDIREVLSEVLKYSGYRVTQAENGQVAMDLLREMERPCLILLDLMMPVMDGWKFVEEARKKDVLATVPVVVVSAYSDKANSIPSTGFIKKPVDLDALLGVVKAHCH